MLAGKVWLVDVLVLGSSSHVGKANIDWPKRIDAHVKARAGACDGLNLKFDDILRLECMKQMTRTLPVLAKSGPSWPLLGQGNQELPSPSTGGSADYLRSGEAACLGV